MGKIDQLYAEGEHRTGAQEVLKWAREKLKGGPVAFGERHTVPLARAVIWDLIEEGNVQRMFLEMENWKDVWNGRPIEALLQELAATVNAPVPNPNRVAIIQAIEKKFTAMEAISSLTVDGSDQSIKYCDLVLHAVDKGVIIYCYDVNASSPSSGVRWAPPAHKLIYRNKAMAQAYNAAPDHDKPGTIVLGGSFHFHDALRDGSQLALMSIAKDRYKECV